MNFILILTFTILYYFLLKFQINFKLVGIAKVQNAVATLEGKVKGELLDIKN